MGQDAIDRDPAWVRSVRHGTKQVQPKFFAAVVEQVTQFVRYHGANGDICSCRGEFSSFAHNGAGDRGKQGFGRTCIGQALQDLSQHGGFLLHQR